MKTYKAYMLMIYEAKTITCVYFTAFVLFYLVLSAFVKGVSFVTMSMPLLLEMMLCCLVLGISHELLLCRDQWNQWYVLAWGGIVMVTTILCSLYFQWFVCMPAWVAMVFYFFLLISIFVFWALREEQAKQETVKLNEALRKFQAQINSEG